METVDYSRFFLSLAFVVGLIWLCSWLARKSGLDKRLRGASGGGGRLQVLDTHYLDPKRKLVLVRADAREYVLVLAGETVTVVDRLDTAYEPN